MKHETMHWRQFDVKMRPNTQPYFEGNYFGTTYSDHGSYLCQELSQQKAIVIDNPGFAGESSGLLGYNSMIFHGDGVNTVTHDGVHLNLVQTGPNGEIIDFEQSSE